ncbi:MAG: zf-TFIIB domain-containing protein [Acidobacteriota bacterium]
MPEKSSENEWFHKHEIVLIQSAKRARQLREKEERSKAEAEEAKQLRELHWMHCPKCGHKMEELGERGIKIDRCIKCHGIYLDRGELEEILLAQSIARRSIFRKLATIITGEEIK